MVWCEDHHQFGIELAHELARSRQRKPDVVKEFW
jgi:hypothetical protein